MKYKIIAAVTSAIMMLSAAVNFTTASAADSNDNIVKIMPVGDSITDGYINGDNGYRKYFCYFLQEKGITNFDMVGPQNGWATTAEYNWNGQTIHYDPNHAGYSGYAIQEITGRQGIRETIFGNGTNMLAEYEPDIVMLQIGTNDLLDCQLDGINDRLESLVDMILPYVSEEGQMLCLASVPDVDAILRSDWLGAYQWKLGLSPTDDPQGFADAVQNAIDDYNAFVKSLVEKKQFEGANIIFSDINSVVDMETGLYDGVHPNESGYECMGKYWADLISESYFEKGLVPPVSEYNVADLVQLQRYILGYEVDVPEKFDVNKDSEINSIDISCLRQKLY